MLNRFFDEFSHFSGFSQRKSSKRRRKTNFERKFAKLEGKFRPRKNFSSLRWIREANDGGRNRFAEKISSRTDRRIEEKSFSSLGEKNSRKFSLRTDRNREKSSSRIRTFQRPAPRTTSTFFSGQNSTSCENFVFRFFSVKIFFFFSDRRNSERKNGSFVESRWNSTTRDDFQTESTRNFAANRSGKSNESSFSNFCRLFDNSRFHGWASPIFFRQFRQNSSSDRFVYSISVLRCSLSTEDHFPRSFSLIIMTNKIFLENFNDFILRNKCLGFPWGISTWESVRISWNSICFLCYFPRHHFSTSFTETFVELCLGFVRDVDLRLVKQSHSIECFEQVQYSIEYYCVNVVTYQLNGISIRLSRSSTDQFQ